MKRIILTQTVFLSALLLVAGSGIVWGQVPQTVSYQGVLNDASGNPVPDGNYSLTFKLYDVATGGTALWSETQPSVQVAGGIFNVILGSVNPLNLAFDKPYWLEVTVGGGSPLTPRIELTSSAYSLGPWSPSGSDIYYNLGKVLIGMEDSGSEKGLRIRGAGPGSLEGGDLRLELAADYDGTFNEWALDAYQDDFRIHNGISEVMRVTPNGNVGIGTTNPEAKLHIAWPGSYADFKFLPNASPAVDVGGSAFGSIVTTSGTGAGSAHIGFEIPANDPADGFFVSTDANTDGTVDNVALKINATGNVGIGTTSPTEKLDVDGNVKISGTGNGIVFPDGSKQTTAATGVGGGYRMECGYSTTDTTTEGTKIFFDQAFSDTPVVTLTPLGPPFPEQVLTLVLVEVTPTYFIAASTSFDGVIIGVGNHNHGINPDGAHGHGIDTEPDHTHPYEHLEPPVYTGDGWKHTHDYHKANGVSSTNPPADVSVVNGSYTDTTEVTNTDYCLVPMWAASADEIGYIEPDELPNCFHDHEFTIDKLIGHGHDLSYTTMQTEKGGYDYTKDFNLKQFNTGGGGGHNHGGAVAGVGNHNHGGNTGAAGAHNHIVALWPKPWKVQFSWIACGQ